MFQRRRTIWGPLLLCAAALAFLAWRMADGLTFLAFSDEATHILGAKMVNAGGVLYRSFVDSHGPFIFMAVQVYGKLFGWGNPNGARMINILLTLAAVASVAGSGALPTRRARLWAVALFAGLLAALWLRQALYMLDFYPMAGALAAIGLAGFVVASWRGATIAAGWAFAGGVALALLAFTAYSFAPSVVLLGLSGLWAGWRQRRAVVAFVLGAAAGAAIMLAYLRAFGDLHGYLSYHIAESQTVYSHYIQFSVWSFLGSLLPSAAPDRLVQSLAVLCTATAAACFWALGGWRRMGPVVLGVAGVLLLNARGAPGCQNGTFVVAAVALAALAAAPTLMLLPARAWNFASIGLAFFLIGVEIGGQAALFAPFNIDTAAMAKLPRWPIGTRAEAPFFQHLRVLVRPDERVLALLYEPQLYLLADRLPMEGFYAWFNWDADYARAPWFGRGRDICTALAASPPPVIVYDDYPVWGYDPHRYMPCLFEVLARHYVLEPQWRDVHGVMYVRRDREAASVR